MLVVKAKGSKSASTSQKCGLLIAAPSPCLSITVQKDVSVKLEKKTLPWRKFLCAHFKSEFNTQEELISQVGKPITVQYAAGLGNGVGQLAELSRPGVFSEGPNNLLY